MRGASFLFLSFVIVISVLAALNIRSFNAPADARIINGAFTKAFEAHFDETFPAKKLGVNLWAAVDYVLFREGRPGVVLGRQGWLYTDEEFKVVEGYERHIRENLALIGSVHRRLANEGISLVVTVVPAKARVYPEYLGGRAPSQAHEQLYSRLLNSLTQARIPTADLLTPLQQGKAREPTYFRADTHWTPWGAKLAAARTAEVARNNGLTSDSAARYITSRETSRPYRGDLFNFLPLDPYFTRLLPPAEQIEVVKTTAAADAPHLQQTSTTELFGDESAPNIALVGTSYSANALWNFAGYLSESLGEEVANYARQGKGPFAPMLSYLRSDDFRRRPPRLVIWEIPERALASPAG
jgi:alginate O-acetyltransferase complex protein AlgJ